MRGSVAFLTGDFVIALKHFVSQVLRKDLEISVSFDLLKELLPGKTINFPPANTLSGVYSLNFLLWQCRLIVWTISCKVFIILFGGNWSPLGSASA